MKLSLEGIKDSAYVQKGYVLPKFDITQAKTNALSRPQWVHLGAGNIFRAFPAVLCQKLLERGDMDTGLTVVECFDEEMIDKAFTPYDNLTLAVTLKSDGTVEKRVVASICEALAYSTNTRRVEEIFESGSLQMVSLTITEKGYSVTDGNGVPLRFCAGDFQSMEHPVSIVAILTRLLYKRYCAGRQKLALVSMDNCSHNGTILSDAVMSIAKSWNACGLVEQGFLDYLSDGGAVSFTWSMIDKITPRPADEVIALLERDGFEGAQVMVTARNTYVSGIVNAEECEYLVVEDHFPNGRPPLEKAGVIFGDRETVDKVEKMKVCTCLNPLHTCLAIFGCLLGYRKISDEMKDAALVELIQRIGYVEGMPVVTDPGIMSAKRFIDEVVQLRLPNPFVPDTPQRIACDTSKKIPVRFGETLKAYLAQGKTDLSFLTFLPLVFAGYARYLTGINDEGECFAPSPDPNLERLCGIMSGFVPGTAFDAARLKELFSDALVFGVDLYGCGLGEKTQALFAEMSAGKGAVKKTIERCLKET